MRQREKLTLVRPAGHEIVAGALGRRLREHRCLEIDEPVRVEKFTHRAGQPVTQTQSLGHDLAAQIQVAILEPQLLAHRLIELKRQRLRAVQDFHLSGEHFNPTGG